MDNLKQEIPKIEIVLSLLYRWGRLEWIDPFNYKLISHQSSVNLNQAKKMSQQESQQMKQYLMTRSCRWQYILNAFGFTKEAKNFKCGHCDNCLKK